MFAHGVLLMRALAGGRAKKTKAGFNSSQSAKQRSRAAKPRQPRQHP